MARSVMAVVPHVRFVGAGIAIPDMTIADGVVGAAGDAVTDMVITDMVATDQVITDAITADIDITH